MTFVFVVGPEQKLSSRAARVARVIAVFVFIFCVQVAVGYASHSLEGVPSAMMAWIPFSIVLIWFQLNSKFVRADDPLASFDAAPPAEGSPSA